MFKKLKNKVLAIAFIVAFVFLGSFSMRAEALTSSADINLVGCASGSAYNTITGKLCVDAVMNPPALGVLPYGCDLGVGTVYSPETGESCSVGGVTITPPIAMFYPWDANGCKAGSPYSMTSGNKCSAGIVPMPPVSIDGCKTGSAFSTVTGSKCASVTPLPPVYNNDCANGAMFSTSTGTKCSGITPMPPVSDCTTAKNASCGGTANTPPTWIPPVKISTASSVDDVKALQASLNKALGAKLSVALSVDGKLGLNTKKAIMMFQKGMNISADGVAGPVTLGKLKTSVQ